jgi:hypothetical protein
MSDGKAQGFKTTDGRLISVRPVDMKFGLQLATNGVRAEYVARKEPLDAPTYTVTTASGATETFPHDATTLQTDADKAAWAQHQAAVNRLDRDIGMAVMRYQLLRGLVCEEPTAEWRKECAFLKIAVPEDEYEAKLLYIQMVVLPTGADLKRAMAAIMAVSATGNEEAVRAAEDLFRSAMEERSSTLDTITSGPVELQPSLPGSESDTGMGRADPVTV